MEFNEMIKSAKGKTIMHMTQKIENLLHDRKDDELDSEDVKTIKDAWKAIWTAMQVCKDLH